MKLIKYCLVLFAFFLKGNTATEDKGSSEEQGENELSVTFRNELKVDVELYWENRNDNTRHPQGRAQQRGGEVVLGSFAGHIFSYDVDKERHYVVVPDEDRPFVVLTANADVMNVRCLVSSGGRAKMDNILDILVLPYWSPRGASRFLELVRSRYYDGVAINRVVPQFLTQFGIGKDIELRNFFRERSIADDIPKRKISFEPGFMSYAGNGPNSRSTEVFVVMPDTPPDQLSFFGKNPWEVPFGIVENINESVVSRWYSYGDMPPDGKGPDPLKIYEDDGYDYLERKFPKMDYIDHCIVLQDYDDFGSEL